MEHWQHFYSIERMLKYESLISYTEVNQRLATNLDFSKLITQILTSCDAVPNIIESESRGDIFIMTLVRECVEIIVIREEQSNTILVLKAIYSFGSLVYFVDMIFVDKEVMFIDSFENILFLYSLKFDLIIPVLY